MKKDNNNFKFLINPIIILVVVSVSLIFVMSVGVGQMVKIRNNISEGNQLKNQLQNKITILQSISSSYSNNLPFLDLALPSVNSAIFVINQIKNLASSNNLIISNINTGKTIPVNESINKNQVSFELIGNLSDVYLLLSGLSQSLPITAIESLTISQDAKATGASVTLSVFSADLPSKIPSITESVNDLTPEEEKNLRDLSQYNLPLFSEPKPQENTNIKPDPFSL